MASDLLIVPSKAPLLGKAKPLARSFHARPAGFKGGHIGEPQQGKIGVGHGQS